MVDSFADSGHRSKQLRDLNPSHRADHRYHLNKREQELLRRSLCTPHTRVKILDTITTWARDASSSQAKLYWLSGSAGSGKSTIAYTIARESEAASNDGDSPIVFGAGFFCSRLFGDTREEGYIVRTIAYTLARTCKGFADALLTVADFESVHRGPESQIRGLLVKPWKHYRSTLCDTSHPAATYLVIIDALDEVEGGGGTSFLGHLLNHINDDELALDGIKFLVTSRPDPGLVAQIKLFPRKQLFRLEDVGIEEQASDVATYLDANLPGLRGRNLLEITGHLFISAATFVKYLVPLSPRDRKSVV